jgi:hypothetical protein
MSVTASNKRSNMQTNSTAQETKQNYYDSKVAKLNTLIENFHLQHFCTLYEVCSAVKNVDFCAIKQCSAWNTCNLTGELCAESVHFVSNGVAYNVHNRFAYFITCLWLCTHIYELIQQQSREFDAIKQASQAQDQINQVARIDQTLPMQNMENIQDAQIALQRGFDVAYEFVYETMCKSLRADPL